MAMLSILLFFPAMMLLTLLPIGVVIFSGFSIIGIIIFLMVEYFIDKYLNETLQKFIHNREELIGLIDKIIHIVFFITKVSISLFGYIMLVGLMIICKELTVSIYIPFLLTIIIPLFFILLLKVMKKNINLLSNIFFLIEPYILTLIFLGIQWNK